MINTYPTRYQFFWCNRLYAVNVPVSANCFHVETMPFCEELEAFIHDNYKHPPLRIYADARKPYLVEDPRKGEYTNNRLEPTCGNPQAAQSCVGWQRTMLVSAIPFVSPRHFAQFAARHFGRVWVCTPRQPVQPVGPRISKDAVRTFEAPNNSLDTSPISRFHVCLSPFRPASGWR